MKIYARTWLIGAALTASAASLFACGGGSASGGGGAGADCSSYDDGTPLGAVEITVVNHRAASVYIPAGECVSRFKITSPDLMTTLADRTSVDLTCEQSQTLESFPLDCLGDTMFEIAPGATVTMTWNGLLYQGVDMPDGCYSSADAVGRPTQCLQGVAPKMGALEASITVDLKAPCMFGENCTPPELIEVKKSFNYPNESAIQMDINP